MAKSKSKKSRAKAKPRVPTKRLRKQIKSLRTGLNKARKTAKKEAKKLRSGLKKEKKELQKAKKTARKAASKTSRLSNEMALVKKEMLKLKARKVAKRQLNEYNLFMRKQLRQGKTFRQAVQAWNRFKKLLNKRRPSAYNQFVAAQLRMGKTFKQAVAAWKAFKSGKKPRARTKIVRKIIVRKAKPKIKVVVRKAKPKRIVRIVKKVVVRRAKPKTIVKTRRIVVSRPLLPSSEIESIVSRTISQTRQEKTETTQSSIVPSDEEQALRIVKLYFEEIARLGFKRSLDLDEIINAYFYALLRIQRSGIELPEIVEAVKKSKIKKSEF